MSSSQLLASLYRNGRVESQHFGSIAIVNAIGRLVAHVGEPYQNVYLRSCAKPFQASVVVSSGAKDRLQLTDQEMAVVAGSHAAEDDHIKSVKSILKKIGLSEKALLCGGHTSAPASSLHHNCSGKHAGMLAVAVDMGHSTSDYLDIEHPVQKSIREAILDATGVASEDLPFAIDGCSAPTFYLPLINMARAYARLAAPASSSSSAIPSYPTATSIVGKGHTWSRSDAFSYVAQVMMNHPHMVAGTGRLDTEVMSAFPTQWVLKGGAEGVQGAGVFESKEFSGPIGIAFKIADGNGRRVAGPVLIEIFRQLRLVNDSDLDRLKKFRTTPELNARGTLVGDLRPEFRLERGGL